MAAVGTGRAAMRGSRSPLFEAGALRAVELDAGDVTALQRFFEANPEYFLNATGRPPAADEACTSCTTRLRRT
jgi:hypothetical protein